MAITNNPRHQASRYLVITTDYLLPCIIALSFALGLYLVLYSPIFRLREFTCKLDSLPCESGPATAELERLRGKNIFLFKETLFINRLKSGDFRLASVEVKKIYPDKLDLVLTTYPPALALRLPSGGETLLLDERRRLISVSEGPAAVPLLLVRDLPRVQVGQTLSSELDLAVLASLLVAKSGLPVKSQLYADNLLRLSLDSGSLALLDPSGDTARQISLLQAVLRDRTITEGVVTIDVRYTQPVLR